jgi:primosomal protein N' (replication factor Y)
VSAAPAAPATVAQVVVDLPVPRTFSYAVPADLAGGVAPGHRVRVPFQGRTRTGVVVGLAAESTEGLEPLAGLVDPVPALTGPLLDLARWAAVQTVSAWGEAVARALPPSTARSLAPPSLPPAAPPVAPGPVRVGCGPGRDALVEAAVTRAAEDGCGALVLAPEIETARAWAARLGQRLGDGVRLVTSQDTPRQRWQTWWACRGGAGRVVVGTRVAAFWPIAGLAATVVVDEHDPTHKALDVPRWHARELAIRRSRLEGGACLLTSGAPSLESWVRVQTGDATAEETPGRGWPEVHRVDLRRLPPEAGAITPGLREAGRAALAAGQSVLLVLNRLGYAGALGCAECGAVRRCRSCRIALTYHLRARLLQCRLCGARQPPGSQCGRCRGRRLQPLGWGTERLEAEAHAAFPGTRVARYDGQVPPDRAAAVREAFRAGSVRVVVGTHMARRLAALAPVGVAALALADTTLHAPDFRAAERTFQHAWLLAEVVAPGGSLWLQSFYPDHPAFEAVAVGERQRFYEPEWTERRELGYPPARRMARVLATGSGGMGLAADLAERCRAAGLAVLGPTELAGGRTQLLLVGGDEVPDAVARAIEPLRGRRRLGGVRLLVDVDPVELG